MASQNMFDALQKTLSTLYGNFDDVFHLLKFYDFRNIIVLCFK